MFKTVIYVASIVSLAYVVALLLKGLNKANKFSKIFFFFTTSMLIWQVLLAFADYTKSISSAVLFLNLGIIPITLVGWLFIFFCLNYIEQKKRPILLAISILWMILLTALAVNKSLITNVEITQYGAALNSTSTVYYVDVISINLAILFGVIYLNFNKKSQDLAVRTQINLITLAVVIDLVGNILGNEIAQTLKGLNWMSQIANLANAIFIVLIAYAIIKHKLFDTRSAIARSISYLFTISAILLIYIIPLLVYTRLFLNQSINNNTLLVLIMLTFLVAIIFQPSKTYFNRVSNRFFYQDYYDPQTVLDQLGNMLVKTIRANEIISETTKIINAAVRPSRLDYLIDGLELSDHDLIIIKELDKLNTNFIYSEDLDPKKYPSLIGLLKEREYSLGIKLRTKDQNLGYLLLGYKKSGNIYSSVDRRFLTIAVDEIAISLQNAINFAEIEKFNITLKQQIEEATRKLRVANAKLKLQDESKDDFISMASHQLRTPLTSVKGYLSLVLDGDAGKISPQQKEMLAQAFFSAQRMVYLISDLLNVSRLKTGKFIIEPSEVNLADVVEQEVNQLKDNASSRNLKFIYQKPINFPKVTLDDTKTRQVIMNFLDNAVHYTKTGGEVNILLSEDDSSVVLKVEDNGIGIAKADQHHLFNKFFRADNAKKARPDGTGIGLYMAKKVIIAEGGSLIFESELDKGSTFGFRLPKNTTKA